jgi:RNA polymerase sigma factor (sigma-70 family)
LNKDSKSEPVIDEQLLPYLTSTSKAESEECLGRLLEMARPIVYRIARSMRASVVPGQTIHDFNTQDTFGDVCIKLLQALRAFKADPNQHGISNYAGLVATTTSTVFSDLLRLKDRQRRNLYEKVRYLISVNPQLASWKDSEGHAICGYAAWQPKEISSTRKAPSSAQLKLDFQSQEFEQAHKRNTAELILLALDNIGHPVRLDELVDLMNIAAQGVQVQTIRIDDKHYVQTSPLVTFQPDIIAADENQRLLHRLFAEIGQLHVDQRKSLLLNMTDSYGFGIEWFIFSKIATEEHLAQLLELTIEQFRNLLNDLPMSDSEIARQLGMDQTKVMNIRRAVRERLQRRRRDFLGEGSSDSVRMK